nr:hypothetical protein CFP56_74131 [Quercus suber]
MHKLLPQKLVKTWGPKLELKYVHTAVGNCGNSVVTNGIKAEVGSPLEGDLGLSDAPLPKPPAGFVVDDHGRLVMASPPSKRITTIVNDEEVEVILPSAAYALSKINMHLVHSGFCYTARGGFCYSEDDIFDFRTDDGQDVDGLPTEGVEITFFHLDGSQYMIYTPSDPLLFVVVKNHTGVLQIADDDLLEDPSIISAIDEETEFNALVEEEAALLESLKLGES